MYYYILLYITLLLYIHIEIYTYIHICIEVAKYMCIFEESQHVQSNCCITDMGNLVSISWS